MIEKLRRKFIFINMTIVTLVLIAVLFLVCFSSYQRYCSQSQDTLRRVLTENQDFPGPQPDGMMRQDRNPGNLIPVFTVEVNADGEITILHRGTSEITEEQAKTAVAAALEDNKPNGTLQRLSLRYLRDDSIQLKRFAFAGTTMEEAAMRNMILTSLLVLAGSLLLLFIISYFLAKVTLKPVQQAWDQQSRFVADASHELKTPLTVILANLKILLAHPDQTIAEQSHWIENTQEETSRMRKLVDNLLFLARSESGQRTKSLEVLNLSDLVLNSLLPLEALAFEEGVTFCEDITPGLCVYGNSSQLKQLVIILLDNACKYTEGNKLVTVTLAKIQEKLLLTVTNTGMPIPPEDLPHLFERFYRSDKSRSREEGGYGLGLSIAQTIVKGHRGKIRVTSEAPTGTTFSVSFPAAEPEQSH